MEKRPFKRDNRRGKPLGKKKGDRREKTGEGDEKRPYRRDGERKPFDRDRKPYSERRKPFDRDRKPYDRDRKPYDKDRKPFDRDRKPYNKDRKPYDRDRKPYDKDRKPFDRDRKPYGDRGPYKKKSYGDRDEKRPYRRDGERKPYDKDRKPFDRDRKPYNKDRKPYERDRKPYDKDRKPFDRDRKPYGDRGPYKKKTYGDRDEKRPYDRERKVSRESGVGSKKKFDDNKPYTEREDRAKKFEKHAEEPVKKPVTIPSESSPTEEQGLIRLNKYIANAGVCSRREADELIAAGAVKVNGEVITQMGFKIKAGDVVNFGGETLSTEKKRYVLLNKPKDYITTTDDPQGRKNVMMLVENACRERIYPVGRLDRGTTGVLLFTNDGDLAKKLTHPKYEVAKMYFVELDKSLAPVDFEAIQNGIQLDDGPIRPDVIEYVGDGSNKRELGIEIHSGRNRIVRRMFETLGYKVVRLDRVMFAGLTKKDVSRGSWRHLTEQEVGFLKMKVGKVEL